MTPEYRLVHLKNQWDINSIQNDNVKTFQNSYIQVKSHSKIVFDNLC